MTQNIDVRLKEHNAGRNFSTSCSNLWWLDFPKKLTMHTDLSPFPVSIYQ